MQADTMPSFDCAYSLKCEISNTNKYFLIETNPSTNRPYFLESLEGKQYKAFPLTIYDKEFASRGFESCLNLGNLPGLIADFREVNIMYINEIKLKTLKPILLINLHSFISGELIFRDGMNGIYAIEKIINDDGEYFIDNLTFPILRNVRLRNDSDDNTEHFLTKSIHNKTYEAFVFRSLLTEQFESALKRAKGRHSSLNFDVSNVSQNDADTLFCAIAEKLDEEKLRKTFLQSGKSSVKDVLFQSSRKETSRAVVTTVDSITKVFQKTAAQHTLSITVPYPSLLHGFLSKHYHKFPVNVGLQRSGIGSLSCLQWDYIPNNGGDIRFDYNFITRSLCVSCKIKTDLNSNILTQRTPSERIAELKAELIGRVFSDHIFGWNIVVKYITYDTETFGRGKDKRSCFVAWGIDQRVWDALPPVERIQLLKECDTDKSKMFDNFIPYSPDDLDAGSQALQFRNEEDEIVHTDCIKWWCKVPTKKEADNKKRALQLVPRVVSSTKKKPCQPNDTKTPLSAPRLKANNILNVEEGRELNCSDSIELFLKAFDDRSELFEDKFGLADRKNIISMVKAFDSFKLANNVIVKDDISVFISLSIIDFYKVRFWKSILPTVFNKMNDEVSGSLQAINDDLSMTSFLVEAISEKLFVYGV